MRIYWRGLYDVRDELKIGVKEVSAPFKGVCQDCKKRLLVRLYPYNWLDNLGVLCIDCYKYIERELEGVPLVVDEFGVSIWMD